MTKILLYGNCQLSAIVRWLQRDASVDFICPNDYGIEPEHDWAQKLFYPFDVKLNESIFEALSKADYFIFQDIVRSDFITSEKLYKASKCKSLCITNFLLKLNLNSIKDQVLNDLKELERRSKIAQKKYQDDYLDMSEWILNNWHKKMLWGNLSMHPTNYYYQELFKQLSSLFLKDCNISHLKMPPGNMHPQLIESDILEVKKQMPEIKVYHV